MAEEFRLGVAVLLIKNDGPAIAHARELEESLRRVVVDFTIDRQHNSFPQIGISFFFQSFSTKDPISQRRKRLVCTIPPPNGATRTWSCNGEPIDVATWSPSGQLPYIACSERETPEEVFGAFVADAAGKDGHRFVETSGSNLTDCDARLLIISAHGSSGSRIWMEKQSLRQLAADAAVPDAELYVDEVDGFVELEQGNLVDLVASAARNSQKQIVSKDVAGQLSALEETSAGGIDGVHFDQEDIVFSLDKATFSSFSSSQKVYGATSGQRARLGIPAMRREIQDGNPAGFDLIVLQACALGTIEAAYELRPVAGAVIGSPTQLSGAVDLAQLVSSIDLSVWGDRPRTEAIPYMLGKSLIRIERVWRGDALDAPYHHPASEAGLWRVAPQTSSKQDSSLHMRSLPAHHIPLVFVASNGVLPEIVELFRKICSWVLKELRQGNHGLRDLLTTLSDNCNLRGNCERRTVDFAFLLEHLLNDESMRSGEQKQEADRQIGNLYRALFLYRRLIQCDDIYAPWWGTQQCNARGLAIVLPNVPMTMTESYSTNDRTNLAFLRETKWAGVLKELGLLVEE
ncbi:hypothetical protein [Rubinisphaera margarita]|uniref:hypothetical protein n=1 Tax=Rubinisphaera margarita TaxID=2909586 RepID=UPI001EE9AAE1|nr:hypothetical protein [Rubinisphaera margarita]MCG6158264.1 hypothetical protein [Rubinisphaera margarita]